MVRMLNPKRSTKRENLGEGRDLRRRLYNSTRWRKVRRLFLLEQPLCVLCRLDGRLTPATVVDHMLGHDDPHWFERFWDERYWQALCAPCHSRKTTNERKAIR